MQGKRASAVKQPRLIIRPGSMEDMMISHSPGYAFIQVA